MTIVDDLDAHTIEAFVSEQDIKLNNWVLTR